MSLTRREFVHGATASGLALGVASSPAAARHSAQSLASQQDEIWIDALGGFRLGEVGLDEIRRSGVTAIDITMGAAGTPTFSYESAVRSIAQWHGLFAQYGDHIIHLRKADDVRDAKRTGKLAVMLGFQNATHLSRDIRNVEFFHDLGIRQIQLTYNSLNALGAGCTERRDVGLSHFGVEVVQKLNEVGILVDLSHVGYQTTLDAIEVSEKPVLFTHTNCMALSKNARCKTDDEIKALAKRGGVMGVSTVNFFVSQKERSTLDDYIAHIVHVAELVGVDHVGIGSDASIPGWRVSFPNEKVFWDFHGQFKFRPEADVRWPPFIEALDVPEKMHVIRDALTKRGFTGTELRKIMGENVLRIYDQVLV